MPGQGEYRRGRYRFRTWLRSWEPSWLFQRWPIWKGADDCGNHEFYNSDDVVERCYHCEVGIRARPSVGRSRPDPDAAIIERARFLHRQGATEEELIRTFKEAGLTWIGSVRALTLSTGKPLGESKRAVLLSDTWAAERPAIDAFHDELEAMVLDDIQDGESDRPPD